MGLEQPGSQLSWDTGVTLPFMSNNDPLPQLPTSSNWANGSKGVTLNRAGPVRAEHLAGHGGIRQRSAT